MIPRFPYEDAIVISLELCQCSRPNSLEPSSQDVTLNVVDFS